MALQNLNQFVELIRDNAVKNTIELQRQVSVDYVQIIARDTPVDTGRATANWIAGINKAPRGGKQIFDKTSTAKPTANKAREVLKRLRFGDEVIIRNAVDDGSTDSDGYIIKLEDGASPQNRTGMFRKNVARYKAVVNKSKKKIGL